MSPLLLASASPRRRALLAEAGVPFDVAPAEVRELTGDEAAGRSAAALAQANAGLKARAAARPGRWVLGADTVVALENRLFGKPRDLGEAREFLRTLGGRTHEVITACALLGPPGREELFHVVTRVTFRALREETINEYLATVLVLDKAGAYALQDRGELLVERVEGSRSNVIGLPMERLLEVLRRHGLAPGS